MVDRVVLDYKDIHRDAVEKGVQSAKDVPYFEGDYWPNVLEESIKVSHCLVKICLVWRRLLRLYTNVRACTLPTNFYRKRCYLWRILSNCGVDVG